jgi:hypothetical protein
MIAWFVVCLAAYVALSTSKNHYVLGGIVAAFGAAELWYGIRMTPQDLQRIGSHRGWVASIARAMAAAPTVSKSMFVLLAAAMFVGGILEMVTG